MKEKEANNFNFTAMSKAQITEAYNFRDFKSVHARIKDIVNIGRRKMFTPKEVSLIVDALGPFGSKP
ncbi:hypothetical protein SAMN05421780_1113 [Flexibacter flexilis DSM 6793]|uniref:DUF4248 domain-containing protein n=1 Tax=Flexibacter flexilis DSM 6793 TaxID=927664 RepID=A0A1I1MMK9_9BACT|nr:hypothetical protein [Flexibacter flexilis]SFC86621.1 hypothetical protein SAMN05421780_1113 [Flexibacter flexilis DSM 6793]